MLLYIHIPFCDSKCHYCAFNSYTHLHYLRRSYMQALLRQLKYDIHQFHIAPKSIHSLFIGGGTPSTVAPSAYEELFAFIRPYLKEDAEITCEANPNSATKTWLKGMYDLGVNRLSFGAQSFDAKKLHFLNRSHSPEQIKEALNYAQSIGFKKLSLDLIYATALDTKTLLEKDLNEAFNLPINHLSAYALTIEEKTHFQSMPEAAKEQLNITRWLFKMIEARGFKQYEISNFGRHKSVHNLGYWEYKPYLGIGSGAVGRIKRSRYYPHKDIQAYINEPLFKEEELLNSEDILSEKLLLAFRCDSGLNYELLSPKQKARADLLVTEQKLHYKANRLYSRDFLLADELALFILDI